jgi:adenylate cyclase
MRGAKIKPIAIGIVIVLLALWLETTHWGPVQRIRHRLELMAYDIRLNATLAPATKKDDRIVIVDIDEKSLRAEGRWPWSRRKLARLTDKLFEAGVVVVAFDITFPEAQPNAARTVLEKLGDQGDAPLRRQLRRQVAAFDNDAYFADHLEQRDVVLGFAFHRASSPPSGQLPPALKVIGLNAAKGATTLFKMKGYTANLPELQRAAGHAGYFSLDADPDGILRRSPLLVDYQGQLYPSLALETVRLFSLVDSISVKTERIGDLTNVTGVEVLPNKVVPTDGEGQVIIPYQGPAGSFTYLSATDVLSGKINSDRLANTIVLVGTTAEGLFDLRATPVQSVYPGVEVHATLIKALLDNRFPVEPAWAKGANVVMLVTLGLLLAFVLPFLRPGWQVTLAAVVAGGLLAFNTWLWQQQGLALSVALPLVMILILAMTEFAYGFIFESRRRLSLKHMFGQYVPPALVEEMSNDPARYDSEGESREMTVLFADIKGFTTLSESLSATDLKQLLNRFFTPMTEVIFEHRGTIDKYVGDMIMAFWGAPVPDEHHARHAVNAALSMLERVRVLRTEFEREDLPAIDIGVGINTGVMHVGDMGSQYRRAYTVLGDAVNLASRLEGLTRYYDVPITIGENTQHQISSDYACRELDLVKVKGKTRPIHVYQPMTMLPQADSTLLEELRRYHDALDLYRVQDWGGAREQFNRLVQAYGDKTIYRIYLQRIEWFSAHPPGPDWDGVFERRNK